MKKKILLLIIIVVILFGVVYYFLNNKKIDIGFKVPNYYTINEINYKDDLSFYQDIYNWYKKMENDKGVYLINNTYFNKDIINEWKKYSTYQNIPLNDFWYFTLSPNYLETMNISVDNNYINDAKNGVRVYLIPNTLKDDEIEKMKLYLQEVDNRVFTNLAPRKPNETITTKFYESPKTIFVSYTPNKDYFTFPSQDKVSLIEKAPIIFICTTNNMTYFESESLSATGINSYIKFENQEVLDKYKNDLLINNKNVTFEKLSNIYKMSERTKLVEKGINYVFE